jgi:MFS family permease
MAAKRFGFWRQPHASSLIPTHIASILSMTGIELVLPTLPLLQSALNLTDRDIVLFTMAYLLPGVLVTLPAGALADRLGAKRVLVIALAGMGACGIALSLSRSLPLLLVFRTIQGLCAGAISPLTITLLGDLTDGARQLQAQAHRSLLMTMGSAGLPVIGGFAGGVHWSVPYALQGIAVAVAAVIWRVVPNLRRDHRTHIAVRSSRLDSKVLAVNFLSLLRFLVMYSFLTFVPLALGRLGFSPIRVGLVLGASAGLGATLAIFAGRMVNHVAPSLLLGTSLTVAGVGITVLGVSPTSLGLIVGSMIYGAGDGLHGVLQNSFLTRVGNPANRGSIVAMAATAKNLGKLLGPPLILVLSRGAGNAAAFAILGLGTILGTGFVRPLRAVNDRLLGRERARQ